MPDEIYGVMAVKNGQKQTIMNLSNARQKSYADLQTMTDAQKKGVIVCPDYPKEEFLVTADEVSYGSGTVKDALDAITPTVLDIPSVTSDANGFIALGITNDHNVLSVSSIGYSFLFWKRSNGYWYATVLNGSNIPVPNSTFNNVKVLYI